HDIIHLSQARSRSLALQYFEEVTVVGLRLAAGCVTALNRARDIFTNRPVPRSVRVLPRQAVLFARRADDLLRILIDLRIAMLLFPGLLRKLLRHFLIAGRFAGVNDVPAVGAEDLLESRHIKLLSGVDECIRGGLG